MAFTETKQIRDHVIIRNAAFVYIHNHAQTGHSTDSEPAKLVLNQGDAHDNGYNEDDTDDNGNDEDDTVIVNTSGKCEKDLLRCTFITEQIILVYNIRGCYDRNPCKICVNLCLGYVKVALWNGVIHYGLISNYLISCIQIQKCSES